MTTREFWLIVAFLIARLIGMITMSVLTIMLLFKLIDNLTGDTNDALTALLGASLFAVAGGASILAAALSRDITEHIERTHRFNGVN